MRFLRRRKAAEPMLLPQPGEPVALIAPDGASLQATVRERASNSLLLALGAGAACPPPAQLQGLVLEFGHRRGRVRLRGAFATEDSGDGRLLRMLAPRSVEIVQQRRYVRIRSARPVVVYGTGAVGRVEGFTVDVSAGGLLLGEAATFAVGEEITFNLALTPGSLPVTGTARVVRVDPLGRCAVSFRRISDADRQRLARFILECQRRDADADDRGRSA